jgi:hypothetical protein
LDDEVSFVVTEPLAENVVEAEAMGGLTLDSEMKVFLTKVAKLKGIGAKNVDSWVEAVEHKFVNIGVTTVSELRSGILLINRRIGPQGASMLHTCTLHAIIQFAEREVNDLKSKVMQLTQELARSRAREARLCEVTHDKDWT